MENLTIAQAYEVIRKQAFEIEGLKDRVSRRNMQIKDLKNEVDFWKEETAQQRGAIDFLNEQHQEFLNEMDLTNKWNDFVKTNCSSDKDIAYQRERQKGLTDENRKIINR